MPRPIGNAASSNVEFGELEAERFDAPVAKKMPQPQSQSSQVEPWLGEKKLNFNEPAFAEAMNNAQELAAQSAKEAAERKQSLKTLGALEAPLMKLAQKFPDPLSVFGNVEFKQRDVNLAAFGAAIHDEAFTEATARLPAKDVRSAVEEQVKKAWPNATPEDTRNLRNYFMRQVNESARERVAPRLQNTATKMLSDAAKSFAATAADPLEVKALAAKLNAMSAPDADERGRVEVRELRAGLGLDADQLTFTPQEVAKALTERAKLLHEESEVMRKHDRPSLFRALSEQDVGPVFMQANGIREGSLLASQISAVREEGEGEKKFTQHVKVASLMSVAFATGGLGVAPAIAMGASADNRRSIIWL